LKTSKLPDWTAAGPKGNVPDWAWYDSGRQAFWVRIKPLEIVQMSEGSLRRFLRASGYSTLVTDGHNISAVEKAMVAIMQQQSVAYAGPLAGHQIGQMELYGKTFLVTESPRFIEAKKGNCDAWDDLITGLFGDQVPYVVGWLKIALQALRAGPPFRPGQMLALAGPAGCGKSLFQNLVTDLLGGRVAKPYRYMTGATPFNSELFNAEHLMIEDEAATTDIRTRRQFGANIKNLLVNETQSYHAKGRNALTLSCCWRLTCSLNAEPENLMVLPPMDESLLDKITLLKCDRPSCLPETDAQRKAFRDALTEQMPAFVHWLQAWKIPKKLKDARYGITAYQHPELIESLASLSPEEKMLQLCDGHGIATDEPWEGTADELERWLRGKCDSWQVERLFTFNTACGVYLGRLLSKHPQRIEKRTVEGRNNWKICPADKKAH